MSNIPKFFYGTAWKEDQTEKLTEEALKAGFRAIDTANQRKHYFEEGAGAGIKSFLTTGKVNREDLFLQTKFTYQRGQDHRLPYDPDADYATQVLQSFNSSLKHLGTDYLDSYVLHGPFSGAGLGQEDWEVWETMEELCQTGQVKHLGVSNFSLEQLVTLREKARVRPQFIQNRCFAATGWDKEIRAYCAANKILYQGFSLLTANLRELNQPQVNQLANKYSASIPQLVFRFSQQIGIIPLTGTTSSDRMLEDLRIDEFTLEDDDLQLLESIGL